VHLDNRIGIGDRKKQLTPVLEHANQRVTPVIIAGDFNTSPFTWLAGVVPLPSGRQDNNLEKLARRYGFDTPVTESGATFRYLGMRLDGIYTRGFETLTFATADAKNVSDHLALWATMRRK
jgi:endonuclease/exonuclease/phosphatase (EEP) superfamily protein YafD